MKQTFWSKFHIAYLSLFTVIAIIAVAFPAMLYFHAQKVIRITESDYTNTKSETLVCEIQTCHQSKNALVIQGWFAQEGKEIVSRKCYVVLKNTADQSCLQLPTKALEDQAAKTYFHDGLQYAYAGFLSVVQINHFKTDEHFLILLLYDHDGQMCLYDTGKTITIGEFTNE